MSDHCNHHHSPGQSHDDPRYRKILWVALIVNGVMFLVEIAAGMQSGSVSLLADAVDFLGDAANYGVSLWVLGMINVWRSRAAALKAACMVLFGILLLARTAWGVWQGTPPEAYTMGMVGTLALVANVGVAALLFAWRQGDANMRSVWLCSRNDALSNIAIMVAALAVWGTRTAWPDLVVAAVMALLAITSGVSIWQQAKGELNHPHTPAN